MHDLYLLLAIGTAAVACGVAVLRLLVWNDLGPAAKLATPQRLLLAAALGSGVIAFTIKLSVIVALSWATSDGRSLAPKVLPESQDSQQGGSSPIIGHTLWEPLPLEAPDPPDNLSSPEKVELGRRLFEDKRLSHDGTIACASCHDIAAAAGADGRPVSIGIAGQKGRRNAPSVFNAAFQARLFWDGRARSLEDQALGPLTNPVEMGNADLAAVAARIAADAVYRDAFAGVFGGVPITIDRIADAIAAFERSLITPDTPYDRFVRGDVSALSPQQQRGMALFESVGCINCHTGPNFSRASVLSTESGRSGMRGFPIFRTPLVDRYGLAADTGATQGDGAGLWRVPSLRNVALTGPWLHNGAVTDLREVVRLMATAQLARVIQDSGPAAAVVEWNSQSRRFSRYVPATISEVDIADIVAFLHALTSDRLTPR
ncbi:MAG: cytochrome c peroxidase [Hyphomicrobiaceae bacterium]